MTTKRLTAEDLAVIEARANAAEAAPWGCVRYFGSDAAFVTASEDYEDGDEVVAQHATHADAEFIAAARTDVPDLIAEVRALTAARDELRAIVDGRKVAPTLAEIAAHSGEWLCGGRRVALYFAGDNDTRFRAHVDAIAANDYLEGDDALRWLALQNDGETLWIALDNGRPCAWPKVTP